MNFLSSLSRKLGFTGEEEEDRSEELEENELEEEDDEEEGEDAPRFSLRFPFSHAQRSRRQPAAYEEDEDEPEEEPPRREPQPSRAASSRRSNVIHDSRMDTRAQEPQYTHCERIISVRQIEECREIIKYLLHGESILLNLENIDPKDCGRVVDLLSGAAFALQGRMIKVAHLSYLLAPENVEIIESDVYGAGRARYGR
ncbi:MAG: cell division protein SepF [Candidatus Ventricola sp.]